TQIRRGPGTGECDVPVGNIGTLELHGSAAVAHGEIVGHALVVLEEVALDGLARVAEAQDEILVPEMCVVLHQVPDDRARTDRGERLGITFRGFPEPHPQPSTEQDYLHETPAFSRPYR